MRISIVIPTYNAEEYVGDCLASIARQSVKPYEVIVVDGLSKDGTLEVVNSFQNILPLIVVSDRDNGQPDAVSKGLRMAGGDIAHWHAADDLVMPGAFEEVLRAFEDPDVGLVYSDSWSFSRRHLSRWSCCRWTCFETTLFFYGRFASDSAYWRHSLTAGCLPLDNSMPLNADEDWFLRIWAMSKKSRWLPSYLGAWRNDRPTQLSRTLSWANLKRDRTISRQRVRAMLGISPLGYHVRRILWTPRYLVVDRTIGLIDRLWRRYSFRKRELERRTKILRFLLDEWSVPPS